jgi:hypothetical protein
MQSVLWFLIILGVLIGGLTVFVVGSWLLEWIEAILVNGGCFIILGLVLIAIGVGLVVGLGGFPGGVGIFLALVAVAPIWFGVLMFIEWLRE